MYLQPKYYGINLVIVLTAFLITGIADRVEADEPAELASIELSYGKVSPGFSSGRFSYTVYVPHPVETIAITATSNTPNASLAINTQPVKDGEPSNPFTLQPGRNTIDIAITNGSEENHYTVKAIRAHPTPNWVKVEGERPWVARDSAGELVFHNRMWLIGGYTPELLSDVWCSSDGIQWQQTGTIPNTSGVNIPVNLVFKDRMWVVSNDGTLYSSADGKTWDLVTESAPWRGRYAAGGAVFNNKLWVMGGLGKGALYNDVWSSADGVQWTLETDCAAWSKRQPYGMLSVLDERLWLLGGGISIYHPFKAYHDVWSSSDGKNWTQTDSQSPWPARIWSTSAVYRDRLWILGGFRSEPDWTNLNDVWYSPDGLEWNELVSDIIWEPRHELSAYEFDDKLWVVAGNSWPLKNDVWTLEISGLVFITQPPIEEFVTAQYSYQARADFNQSRRTIHYRLTEGPEWLRVDEDSGFLQGIPNITGDFPITLEAYDDTGETATQSFTLHVLPLG